MEGEQKGHDGGGTKREFKPWMHWIWLWVAVSTCPAIGRQSWACTWIGRWLWRAGRSGGGKTSDGKPNLKLTSPAFAAAQVLFANLCFRTGSWDFPLTKSMDQLHK